ncbi:MAG: hypothetical protein E7505_06080 [Ruminococcus sp.]|nr:hypothetical protein [Ruminococcus sp.]
MENKKILAEVVCPATSRTYDFVLEAGMTAGSALKKIAAEIINYERMDMLFSDIGSAELFCDESELPLAEDITLDEYGITSGSRLMII